MNRQRIVELLPPLVTIRGKKRTRNHVEKAFCERCGKRTNQGKAFCLEHIEAMPRIKKLLDQAAFKRAVQDKEKED